MKVFNRRRLVLRKDGSFYKYITYAIGEIVLVILGILIALQIDYWSKNRQDDIDISRFLNTIENNINYDQKKLEELLKKRQTIIQNSRNFLQFLEKDSTPPGEDYKEILKQLFDNNAWSTISFQSNRNGIETLKSSGFLSKIDKKNILDKLNDYYYLVDKIEFEEQGLNMFISEMEVELFKKNIIPELRESTRKLFKNTYSEYDMSNIDRCLKTPSFYAVQFRMSGSAHIIDLYSELMRLGDEITELIKYYRLANKT